MAKGVQTSPLAAVAPLWSPPDELDDWPDFDVADAIAATGMTAERTHWSTVHARIADAGAVHSTDAARAVAEFLENEMRIARHGDAYMVTGEHVRAWLLASIGPLLRGLLLSPEVDPEVLTEATVQRVRLPARMALPGSWVLANEFGDKYLELLLNLRMQSDGNLAPLDVVNLRIGQGESWRESWSWLSDEIDARGARAGVRLAAQIMRNEAVLTGVTGILASDEEGQRLLAAATLRRWMLTLKAMTWLEEALDATWHDVRPADLACTAFAAVKPEWPRRTFAVSHRSAEVKPALRRMPLWSSSRCAIDATYVPAWETNTGMLWGLFAATPAVLRVDTPRYGDSVWCRREHELTQYLLDSADFLTERYVLDVDLEGLERFGSSDRLWKSGAPDLPLAKVLPEFPPMITVWTPPPLALWEASVLRAAGALRAMSAFLGDPQLVNGLVTDALLPYGDLPGPAPTNHHPGGWRRYAGIFRDLRELVPDGDDGFALLLPQGYGADQMARDKEVLERVPDLAYGAPALDDVLVAVEFVRTIWPVMVEQGYGRFLAVNCRGLSREEWRADDRLSLQRGLVALRTPVPVWLLQLAGQEVHAWGLPGDHPVLTEHLERQFTWMTEAFPDPQAARAAYPEVCGLKVSTALRQRLGAPL